MATNRHQKNPRKSARDPNHDPRNAAYRIRIAALPWDEIRRERLERGTTFADLAERYDIDPSVLRSRASREDWTMLARRAELMRADNKSRLAKRNPGTAPDPKEALLAITPPAPMAAIDALFERADTAAAGHPQAGHLETGTPGDPDARKPGDGESGNPDQGVRGSGGQGVTPELSALSEKTESSIKNEQREKSTACEISLVEAIADKLDPHIARICAVLTDGAIIAKPRTVGELSTLQQVIHRAARGWRRESGTSTGFSRIARVPGRVVDAEQVRDGDGEET